MHEMFSAEKISVEALGHQTWCLASEMLQVAGSAAENWQRKERFDAKSHTLVTVLTATETIT